MPGACFAGRPLTPDETGQLRQDGENAKNGGNYEGCETEYGTNDPLDEGHFEFSQFGIGADFQLPDIYLGGFQSIMILA